MLKNGLLSKQQHGFLAKRSTITQLLDCCKDWMQNINRNSQTDIIYLDFAKAFDSVVHSKLLLKLERYGIDGLTLKWINAFLTNRTQKVKVGSHMSSSSIVTSGVPQGSVLGPVLFLIFINDICNLPNFDVNMKLFADDVKLYLTLKDKVGSEKIQKLLDSISQWCNEWQLNLSPSKCVVLSLGRTPSKFMYNINNLPIQHVQNFKDLGVTIDPLLNFESHINEICSKANQRAALILKCFKSREPTLLIKAFTTFVRPLLEYASSVWCPYKTFLIEKIESVQRRFSKKLEGLKNFTYKERLEKLNLESLETRRLKADLTFYYKIINNFSHLDATELFTFVNSPATRGHKFKLLKPRCSTNLELNKFNCRAVNAWNSLDESIVLSPSVACFKHQLSDTNLSKFAN